jgi:preprotein translocase subunit YajC
MAKFVTRYGKRFLGLSALFLISAAASRAQAPDAKQTQGGPPAGGMSGGQREGRGPGLFGKIAFIGNGTIELTKPDGSTLTIKLTDKTEFRKDRQPAKLSDFQAGDLVFVRGEENADHSVTAQMIGGRSGAGPGLEGAGRGPGGGPGGGFGELGKDFILGEVKSVDAPKMTILRPDNVTQIVELNEGTSLHRGRESITMADIQPGDHVVVRGGLENNTFVPKNVMLLTPEQWTRMQEMRAMVNSGNAPAGTPPANVPKSNPPQR